MGIENSAFVLAGAFFARIANARALTAAAAVVWNAVVGIGTCMDRMIGAHERWRQRRALLSLDDHLLKDIGVSRADVEREVAKMPWRD